MADAFSTETIDQIAKRSNEPEWLTELRHRAWATHVGLPWPHKSDDVWRRTDVALLDPTKNFLPVQPGLLQSIPVTESRLAELTQPLGDEQLAARANGAWLTETPHGIVIEELGRAARTFPDPIRQALEADGLTMAEQKLASLNAAFHHDDLYVQVPAHFSSAQPFRLIRLFSLSAGQAVFPMTIITVGAGSSVTLIDEYLSSEAAASPDSTSGRRPERSRRTAFREPHLVHGRIELVLERDASVHYVRLQRWDANAREFLLQRATLASGATLTMANINLGAALSKAHVVARLTGEGASTKLYGFVFGHGTQHVDQHTLQDHQAPHTSSDLQFRAALQDESRMVYTGLIRIAKQAKQTNAYQANHNLLLSRTARAETIPMLEILADDVQCKHGASIGPIDDEQAFYLMSRGVPREAAQRLIVMGFIEPIIQQVPFAPLQERLRREIEGELQTVR